MLTGMAVGLTMEQGVVMQHVPSVGSSIMQLHSQHCNASVVPAVTLSDGCAHAAYGKCREVVRRTAAMVAAWQTVGFCHGVLNTDNMSIIGATLDYGYVTLAKHCHQAWHIV